jgi:hypothetical protein
MKLKFIVITIMTAALAACGGGGGGSTTAAGQTSISGPDGATATVNSNSSAPATSASALVLNAKVNGADVPGFAVTAGSTQAITINSGQELEITSSVPTVFGGNMRSAVAAVRTSSFTVYKAVLGAADDTTATLTFTSISNPTKTATAMVTVKAASFAAVQPKAGDSFVYLENDQQFNGALATFSPVTHRVDVVNSDGSWKESYLDTSSQVLSIVDMDADGNRMRAQSTSADSNSCPDALFTPAEKLLAFPLAVGHTYTGAWTTSCGTDHQDEAVNTKVTGYESVATQAGVFLALRIDQTTTVTNSTNPWLPGGGYVQNVSIWFDPVLGRGIKYSGTRAYDQTKGTVPPTYLVGMGIELVNASKN